MVPGTCSRTDQGALSHGQSGTSFFHLGDVTAAVLDQNGAVGGNGVNAIDLALFSEDHGTYSFDPANYRGRSDYSFDGRVDAIDLAVFKDHLGNAALGIGSGSGCFSDNYCP